MSILGTYLAMVPNMSKKPFTSEMMSLYVDRLVRHNLLGRQLGDDPHPCMVMEDFLLHQAEAPIMASADFSRRSPSWPMLKTWFSGRVIELARAQLSYYGFPPAVCHSVLADLIRAGFDHLLERKSAESGIQSSLGSNVMSSSQWKTS